ncbi:hypothetical protein [Nocardioides sp.]|uniref:hypothetical protein n=1 Tax=Nocardioides sp. TaxID=35761 RepID=UPI002601BB43|nr:hypothetical protein [Nocardioides sp.]MCW2735974.1 hypothetical protein [Nocardioides sp.]
MRRTSVTILVALLVSAGAATGARADTPRCVSRGEFDRVTQGMTMTKVHKIFDTPGQVTGLGAPNELRYYDTCTGRGVVQVVFSPRGRMLSKDGHFF